MPRVIIIGGGPGGYEAALVANDLGADVTVIEQAGLGGSAVLTDSVPSKTLVATSDLMVTMLAGPELGITLADDDRDVATMLHADLARVNARVKALAAAQSRDIEDRLKLRGVKIICGTGRLVDGATAGGANWTVIASRRDAPEEVLHADAVLIATGARPRTFATAEADGERILTWDQVYDLRETPTKLIVVGSGVTGLEFASAYLSFGIPVTLVSSRDRVLPTEDFDAAAILEDVLIRRGMTILARSRMQSVKRAGDTVTVTLTDGSRVAGSHCILALGSVPNTTGLGLEDAGIQVDEGGFVRVDRVSRTTALAAYAAGDCTGGLMLASVAAMAGRTAMRHLLGDAVQPLDPAQVSSNVFTNPEIATVGVTGRAIDSGETQADVIRLDLKGNPRAKMQGVQEGFVKLYARPGSGTIVGGVVVAPRASELIHPIALAVSAGITANQLASAYTVYPSISGSLAEAARHFSRAVSE